MLDHSGAGWGVKAGLESLVIAGGGKLVTAGCSLDGLPELARFLFCFFTPIFHGRCQGLCSLPKTSYSVLTHPFIISLRQRAGGCRGESRSEAERRLCRDGG